jgi:type II restriction enzyme
MSSSNRLSETLQGNIKNNESQPQDIKIKDVIGEVKDILQQKYPDLKFDFEKKKMLRTIEKMVNGEDYTTSDKSFITPDGGFLWVKINGKKYCILISEQKRQGTNDRRIQEGKLPQSCGNAVERFPKNKKLFDIIFSKEEINPTVAFFQGCDFCDEETTIGDRVRSFMDFQPQNQINLKWKQLNDRLWSGGSYFMRGHSMNEKPGTSDWTSDEMLPILLSVATQSTEYYLSKYGK